MFSKKINKETQQKIDEYKANFVSFLNDCSDENQLNKIFTEITLFRMSHDKYDGFIKNQIDSLKRKQNINRNALIITQLDDILDNLSKKNEQYDNEVNSLFKKCLPSSQKNAWTTFWDFFIGCFNKGAGKK